MKFSIITTVLNEEKSIIPLLESLSQQTLLPAEVILVDAGSKDATKNRVKTWSQHNAKISFQLIELPGSNRSEGRNHGISIAKHKYIAITDAGCEADKDWLKKIAVGFDDKHTAVAGFYTPAASTQLQKLFSLYTSTLPKNFDSATFLPSSRSLAFTHDAWLKAGKYPEHLDTCEDLVFAKRLKAAVQMNVASDAIVYWHQAQTLKQFFKQIYGYARGDVAATYAPHVVKIISMYLRYAFFALYPPLFLVYLFYPAIKFWKETYRDGSFFLLPIVQVAADLAVIAGGIVGFFDAIKHQLLASK